MIERHVGLPSREEFYLTPLWLAERLFLPVRKASK